MAKHSHWARIKHAKGVTDVRRGKLFSKLSKAIISAVRMGGPDPTMNPRLMTAVEKARGASVPKDNIDRAIQRGAGSAAEDRLEEVIYEAYGVGGASILIEALTDNRNRIAPELRLILEDHGGSLAGVGSVAWNFEKKGILLIARTVPEETLMDAALALGADDIQTEEDQYHVIVSPQGYEALRKGLAERGIQVINGEIERVPKTTVLLSEAQAERMIELLSALEDHEDVQNLYTNYEVKNDGNSTMPAR